MDLSTLLPLDEIVLAIKDPRGAPTDITITLAGPAHPVTLAVDRAQADERFKAKEDPTLDQFLDEFQNDMVSRTLGWENVAWQGAPLPFSVDNARMLYANPSLSWLRNQVSKSLRDVNLFFPV